jgi:hypothetical protein
MTFIPTSGDHPALREARKRLASLERRSPPGYPLGYRLDIHIYSCTGCGAESIGEQMVTLRRAGSNGLSYAPTHSSETLWDLPVDTATLRVVTPRCSACIDAIPREAIPRLPAGNARLKPRYAEPAGLADLLEGLDI